MTEWDGPRNASTYWKCLVCESTYKVNKTAFCFSFVLAKYEMKVKLDFYLPALLDRDNEVRSPTWLSYLQKPDLAPSHGEQDPVQQHSKVRQEVSYALPEREESMCNAPRECAQNRLFIKLIYEALHSRPQRLRSTNNRRPTPKVRDSRTLCQTWEIWLVNEYSATLRMLRKSGQARGCDSGWRPKGARSLGTRMFSLFIDVILRRMWKDIV